MMKLCPVLITSTLAVWLSNASTAGPHASQSPDAWTREKYSRALELVLPDRCHEPTLLDGERAVDARWMSCVRIVPAFKDDIEYSLSVEKRYNGRLFAWVVRPKNHSIYGQLYELKKKQPKASVNELAKLIEVESYAGDQRRFPRLADLANEFETLRLSPVLSDEIMMDPAEYTFRVLSSSGENMLFTLYGPGSEAPVQPRGPIQWAESARAMLAAAFK